MSRLLFEARAAVLACEAQQALIEKEIELEKLKQQRKPLTRKQLADAWIGTAHITHATERQIAYARAVEAAHGITKGGAA